MKSFLSLVSVTILLSPSAQSLRLCACLPHRQCSLLQREHSGSTAKTVGKLMKMSLPSKNAVMALVCFLCSRSKHSLSAAYDLGHFLPWLIPCMQSHDFNPKIGIYHCMSHGWWCSESKRIDHHNVPRLFPPYFTRKSLCTRLLNVGIDWLVDGWLLASQSSLGLPCLASLAYCICCFHLDLGGRNTKR